MFIDGLSKIRGSRVKLILESEDDHTSKIAINIELSTSNNQVEYVTFQSILHIALKMGVKEVIVIFNSKLVTLQVKEEYHAKYRVMQKYLASVKAIIA